MSEFFLELFSEEIPPTLQSAARDSLLSKFKNLLNDEGIKFDMISESFSIPNRLVVYFKNIEKEVEKKSEEIKGPSTNAPKDALDGFKKSRKIKI